MKLKKLVVLEDNTHMIEVRNDQEIDEQKLEKFFRERLNDQPDIEFKGLSKGFIPQKRFLYLKCGETEVIDRFINTLNKETAETPQDNKQYSGGGPSVS